jgi:hypothetical protein
MSRQPDSVDCSLGYRVERVPTLNPDRPKWYARKRAADGKLIASVRAKSAKHAFTLVERWKHMETTR